MATIGETLRAAREARGLSIEDVRNTTQIKAMQLQEMEADDYSWFSAPVYAKGFLRLFARAVGLDPGAIVARFEAEAAAGQSASKPDPTPTPKPVPVPAAPQTRQDAAPEKGPAQEGAPTPAAEPAVAAEPTPEASDAETPPPEPPSEPDLFSLPPVAATAPAAAAPAATPAAPAPTPAPAPSSPRKFEKRVASTPLAFERKPQPRPLGEKRVAPPEPGAPPPTPAITVRETPRPEVKAQAPAPVPVVKPAPVPQSALSPDARLSDAPALPDPLPQDGPLFVFPAYQAPVQESTGEETAPSATESSTGAETARPGPLVRSVESIRQWKARRDAAAAARASAIPVFGAPDRTHRDEASASRRSKPAPEPESPFAAEPKADPPNPLFAIPKAITRRHVYAAAAVAVLLAAAGILGSLGRDDGAEGEDRDSAEFPIAAPQVEQVAQEEPPPPPPLEAEDPVPVLPPPPSFAN